MLHTEPSFSIYSSNDKFDSDTENEDLIKLKLDEGKLEKSSVTIGENVEAEFSFGSGDMGRIEEDYDHEEEEEEKLGKKYGEFDRVYDEMSKKEFSGAEEYYFHATLADPYDGEILSQYAKFLWENNHDQERALVYFEKAAQAAPKDSGVLAAYASFLWEIGEEEDQLSNNEVNENLDEEYYLRAIREDPSNGQIISEYANFLWHLHRDKNRAVAYFEKSVKATPEDSTVLASYAKFLWETADEEEDESAEDANNQPKEEIQETEEYYSRAIQEDPDNGQLMLGYANFLWKLHREKDRAVIYFERAVKAAPNDSHVLASYAKFLWENDEDDEED